MCCILYIDDCQCVIRRKKAKKIEERDVVLVCKALGDVKRLHIVEYLTQGELCACEILERLQITQPTLSHHMKALCDAGLIRSRREGKWMHYSLNCGVLSEYRQFIGRLKCAVSAPGTGGSSS